MNFWDSWTKPWTRDQCRDHYVQGPGISYSQLAQISGVPLGTINRWAKGDLGKSWKIQREEFWTQQRLDTDQKAIINRSDALALLRSQHEIAQAEMVEELSVTLKDLGLAHFEAYRSVRSVAMFMLGEYEKSVRELTGPIPADIHPEQREAIAQKRIEFQLDPSKFFKAIIAFCGRELYNKLNCYYALTHQEPCAHTHPTYGRKLLMPTRTRRVLFAN